MIVSVSPFTLKGTVCAPPSKSAAHRHLICAYLSHCPCEVENLSDSEDILATLDCISALGAMVEKNERGYRITPGEMPSHPLLPCRESGSTLRFFIPYALTLNRPVTFTGTEKLLSRPLDYYEQLCKTENFTFCKSARELTVCGNLSAGAFSLRGDITSQYITGLMFALAVCGNTGHIKVLPPFESKSYVVLTGEILKQYGIQTKISENTVTVCGNNHFTPCHAVVEGDYSNAAYLDVFGMDNACFSVTGLSEKSVQGDRVYASYFQQLHENATLDISDCPDLGPVLFAVAAAHKGGHFTGTKRLKIKESDRAEAMRQELSKCGVRLCVEENTVTVFGGTLHAPTTPLFAHNDHRILMALVYVLSFVGGCITGGECVKKSFPDFFQVIKRVGAQIEITENK